MACWRLTLELLTIMCDKEFMTNHHSLGGLLPLVNSFMRERAHVGFASLSVISSIFLLPHFVGIWCIGSEFLHFSVGECVLLVTPGNIESVLIEMFILQGRKNSQLHLYSSIGNLRWFETTLFLFGHHEYCP